jgi:hypothetical protein
MITPFAAGKLRLTGRLAEGQNEITGELVTLNITSGESIN